jgi:hypothetical protein
MMPGRGAADHLLVMFDAVVDMMPSGNNAAS